RQERLRAARVDARGVLRQVALLWRDIEAREQRESFVGHEGHDVALALDGPELEREARAKRMSSRNHLGTGQSRRGRELLNGEPHQLGQEQEEPATARREAAWCQREVMEIGNCLDAGTDKLGPLLIESARQ